METKPPHLRKNDNLNREINRDQHIHYKNLVKIIFSDSGKIIYFSRAKAPFDFKGKGVKYYRDLSIISFQPQALKKYNHMKMGKLEKIEEIELLRALEIGLKIKSPELNGDSFSIDVKEDYLRAKIKFETDKFFNSFDRTLACVHL